MAAPAMAELAAAVRELGSFAAELDLGSAAEPVRQATDIVVFDSVGVIVAGMRTDELRALL